MRLRPRRNRQSAIAGNATIRRSAHRETSTSSNCTARPSPHRPRIATTHRRSWRSARRSSRRRQSPATAVKHPIPKYAARESVRSLRPRPCHRPSQYAASVRAAWTMSATCGSTKSSSDGAYGNGTSCAVTRSTGASSQANELSLIRAVISPASPPVRVSSCTIEHAVRLSDRGLNRFVVQWCERCEGR